MSRLVPALATLVFLGPAFAQTEAAAVRRMKSAVRGEASAADRRAAVDALAEFDTAKVAKVLIDAYVDLEPEALRVRERRAKFLARDGGSKLLRPLRHALQDVRDVQDAILERLGELRAEESVRVMQTALLRAKKKIPWTLKVALAEASAGLAAADVGKLTTAAGKTKEKAVERAVLLLRALAPLGPRAAASTAWMLEQLEHAEAEVRIEAAAALAKLRAPSSIEPLIARLDHVEGIERERVLDALVILTGQYPGETARTWQLWFRDAGKPFVEGDVPLGRGDVTLRERDESGSGATSGSYFGIPQTGRSILYVFDNSLTMKQKMRKGGETRWKRCKDELHAALRQLRPGTKFNLMCFANYVRAFDVRMLEANESNLERAHAWIDSLKLEFETNAFDALERAFTFAGRGVADRYYDPEVDTIFFLSDGVPTWPKRTGGGIEREKIGRVLAGVRRWNPLRRVTVHAIGLKLPKSTKKNPNPPAREFMRKLAEQNGGRFIEPK